MRRTSRCLVRVGDMVWLKHQHEKTDVPREARALGLIIAMEHGSFAQIGMPYAPTRVRVMWSNLDDRLRQPHLSYEFFHALVRVSDESG